MGVRRRLLSIAFNLLYGPLAPMHEIAGIAVAGNAWHGRRLRLLEPAARAPVVDVGCGEGRLVHAAAERGIAAFGLDPSVEMLRRARRRNAIVVRSTAQRLPLRNASVALVVCSYPGPWIADPQVWIELERVLRVGGEVRVLIGGTNTVGRGARLRSALSRLVYGDPAAAEALASLPRLGSGGVAGGYQVIRDEWGSAVQWRGVRSG